MAKSIPVCLDDFEKYAFDTLPRNALDYFRSGANLEETLSDNINAFKRFKLRPRFLRDVSKRDMSTTILGHKIAFPVCIAPTAMNKMAHSDGEPGVAQAAYESGIGFTMSTISTTSIEELVQKVPNGLKFFQLYIYRDREVTLELLRRAERAGFKAIILTVDTPFFGKRLADNRNKFKLPSHLRMANFSEEDVMGAGLNQAKDKSGLNEYANSLFDPSLNWRDVEWLKKNTKLPLVVKGILTGEDAVEAVNAGVDGILVSNHGARQLDGVAATIDVLPEIVKAVNGRCQVYLDGGIRVGTDILKALALGATAVFIGRPAIYSLTYNGSQGVKAMLDILKDEFDTAMALSGCAKLTEITSDLVMHQSQFNAKL